MPGGSIPAFNADGLLPPGVHPAELQEVRSRLVDGFPHSTTRRLVFTGYESLHDAVSELALHATEWADGSFVENKLDPQDFDVVHFVDNVAYDSLSAEKRIRVESELSEGAAKTRYLTHSIWIPVFPKGHPNYDVYEETRKFYRGLWGRTRPIAVLRGNPGGAKAKGFLKLTVGDAGAAPSVPEAM